MNEALGRKFSFEASKALNQIDAESFKGISSKKINYCWRKTRNLLD
jgi:hypothetical protein